MSTATPQRCCWPQEPRSSCPAAKLDVRKAAGGFSGAMCVTPWLFYVYKPAEYTSASVDGTSPIVWKVYQYACDFSFSLRWQAFKWRWGHCSYHGKGVAMHLELQITSCIVCTPVQRAVPNLVAFPCMVRSRETAKSLLRSGFSAGKACISDWPVESNESRLGMKWNFENKELRNGEKGQMDSRKGKKRKTEKREKLLKLNCVNSEGKREEKKNSPLILRVQKTWA